VVLGIVGASVAAGPATLAQEATREGWLLAGDAVTIVAAAFAVVVVRRIDRRQERKRARQSTLAGPTWEPQADGSWSAGG
jgi:hypothetical protein